MATSLDAPTHQTSSIMTTLSPSSPIELRHITSNTHLASPTRERRLSKRASQHLRTHRMGSRSPSSIPSSPTSVHSSSSAIFERDIEPITPASASLSISSDPHRIPRGKISEQLEHSVPSVLDSAAAILAGAESHDDDFDSISIVSPATLDAGYRSGFTSPMSRLSSRSPSPTAMGNRKSLLFATSPLQNTSPLQSSPPIRPTIQTSSPPPVAVPLSATPATPTSAYYSVPSTEAGSEASSPTTATHHEHPMHNLPPQAAIMIPTTVISHPPSPKNATKRLSFLSYMDLLTSAPASTLPLSSFTSSAVVSEPPPHLQSVIGLPQAHYAASSSAGSIHGAAGTVLEREIASGMLDDVGGEWEREGLGRGLEERLEALNALPVGPGKA
ncbi:uncharacterized protein FIBRA_04519 [Fibroporia radiculosa]|uniref:Uncharacterized protein n=1 Tax=Fibroporia radiculosa TaxID=599839 RepID=J4IA75_9APHY|nr:uncharacterized protein FIBRA_04519 [Fibroporia radiculosa]CCM02421.1 predicted protein [Fibroporia radiculosa]